MRRLTDGRFHLGLPAWAFAGWRGRYLPARGPTLAAYGRYFSCVEGNTTFYSLPAPTLVARWRQELQTLPPGRDFRFCFKLPRGITHDIGQPRAAVQRLIEEFFDRLAPLAPWLGPFMVQFPASVSVADLAVVDALLARLPRDRQYVVEARAPLLFTPEPAHTWRALLHRHDCARVILDSRPIHGDAPAHPDLAAAPFPKPNLALLLDEPGARVVVRLICHPLMSHNLPFMAQWRDVVAAWVTAGTDCFFMVHCPNDLHSPQLARAFHELIAPQLGLPALPPWPTTGGAQQALDW